MQNLEPTTDARAKPPLLRILPWFTPEDFERDDDGRYAHLRLSGSMRDGARAPLRIELVVCRGRRCRSYLAVAVCADRRGHLRLSFSLPPAAVDDPAVRFRLLARDRGEVELPQPVPAVSVRRRARVGAAALSSVAALTVSALMVVPAASLADGPNPAQTTEVEVRALTTGTQTTDTQTTTTGTQTTTGSTTGTQSTTGSTTGTQSTTGTDTSAGQTDTGTSPTTSGTDPSATDPGGPVVTTDVVTGTDAAVTTGSASGSTTTAGAQANTDGASAGSSTSATTTSATTTPSGTTPPTTTAPTTTTTRPGTTTTRTTTSTTGTTPKGSNKHRGSSSGSLSSRSNAAISNGISAGTGALSPGGKIKQGAGIGASEPSAKVLPPTSAPASSYTIAGGAGGLGGVYGGSALAQSWGGALVGDPFTALQLARFAKQIQFGQKPPKYLVKIYKRAARRYRLPWQVLAAINYVETGYGSDLGTSSAGAVGWMQFEPSTWAQYGEAVSATGQILAGETGNPYSPRDAIYSAARLLVANGARHNLARAVYGYNHAGWYVQEVLTLAERIIANRLGKHPKPKQRVAAMLVTARMLRGITYVWGGGHTGGDWVVQVGYDCSGFVSAVLHAGGFLRFPQTTQTLPAQAGILSGPGRRVTIYDRTNASINDDHVIVKLGRQFWEEGGGGPNGADLVHRMGRVDPTYLASFNLILHPKGL